MREQRVSGSAPEPRWEKEIREVYHHLQLRVAPIRRLHSTLVLYVSYELAMEIQNTPYQLKHNIKISTNDITWQGIPIRLNARLNPGCFIFDEGDTDE